MTMTVMIGGEADEWKRHRLERLDFEKDLSPLNPDSMSKFIANRMTFKAINLGLVLSSAGLLSFFDLVQLLVYLLDAGDEKMTKMLNCLPISDPVFKEISTAFLSTFEENEITMKILFRSLLLRMYAPCDEIRLVFIHWKNQISTRFLFSLLEGLADLFMAHREIVFPLTSIVLDLFWTRMVTSDEFVPLLIRYRSLVQDEIQLVTHSLLIKGLLHSETKDTRPAPKPREGYEEFEWRLLDRLLV